MRNKTTAALLAFLLGGIGIQHFYLGKTVQGVLSILFFWTLIPAFIAIIDIIRFLLMSNAEFDRKYNIVVAAVPSPSPVVLNRIPKTSMEAMDELEKLYELKEKGILTEGEFTKRKEKMLQSY
ncbi:NINE protein [Pontibacter korlensis]|uniref:TM2 domain-containing protein n=1 Tax=Pontibacter korlensis TaxID=400092 RepID=A0A0E3ZHB8_9BACT|nr:NINE protein [Pontibacter korlensis]AKD04369.1 hypothetical protein PKOR_16345 [Pontibacter korlensis]